MIESAAEDALELLTANEVIALLAAQYGDLPQRPHREPIDELVLGDLSQNTSDVNSGRAFESLRRAFPEWQAVVEAPSKDIEMAIRAGGLAPTKSLRIKALLAEIRERRARTGARLGGSFDLSFLRDVPLDEAEAWLASLPGVGPKTAAVVLMFSLGRPSFPVDTHVYRVLRRLGMAAERTSPAQAQSMWEARLAPEDVYAFHMYLIVHGRRTCRARRPLCPECGLRDRCPAASTFYPSLGVAAAPEV